jgi:hypothetical protein
VGNNDALCPRADQLHAEIAASAAYRRVTQENGPFLVFLSNQTGQAVTLKNINELWDVRYIEVLQIFFSDFLNLFAHVFIFFVFFWILSIYPLFWN